MTESSTEEKTEPMIESDLPYWMSQAKLYRFLLNAIYFIVVIISWQLLASMAMEASLAYDDADLILPFVVAAQIILLVYIAQHFIRIVQEIYYDEIDQAITKVKSAVLSKWWG